MSVEVVCNIKEHIKTAFMQMSLKMLAIEFEETDSDSIEGSYRLSVIINMVGKFKGNIIFTAGEKTSRLMAENMLGEDVKDNSEMFLCLTEFLNTFCGKAITKINNQIENSNLRLSPPALFAGEDLMIKTPHITYDTQSFKCEAGVIQLEIGIEGV